MPTPRRRTLERLASIGLAAGATSLGWVGLVMAMSMVPEPGVVVGNPGGPVVAVLPGSFAWHDGIRESQIVVEVRRDEAPVSWELSTRDGDVARRTATAAHEGILRRLVPWALGGAILGILAIALAWSRRAGALPLAGAAAVVGTLAFLRLGDTALSTVGALAALGIPVLGAALLIARRTRPGAIAVLVGGAVLAGAWLAARAQGPIPFEIAEPARAAGSLGAVGLSITIVSDPAAIRRALLRVNAPRLVDVVSLTVAGAVLVGVWALGQAEPLLVLLLALGLLVAYPTWRRTAIRVLDGILVAQIRERASLTAAEAEREQLARELHDEPLQHLQLLAGRLQERGATTDAESVLGVISHLRALMGELHSPVLRDIGLGAALETLIPAGDAGPPTVTLAVADLLEPAGERLPPEVELAAYRIVQEALRNAIRHATATRITIEGTLAPGSLVLRVIDDGVGHDERRVRAAERDGHVGLAHMRQRAAAIEGHLAIRGGRPGGTTIELTWEADGT